MLNNVKILVRAGLVALLAAMISAMASCKKGKVVETIGSHDVTTSEYEEYYSTYVEKVSRLYSVEKKTLFKLMCNPDRIPPNPALQSTILLLQPENNYEQYRDMLRMYDVARKEGFMDRPIIKNILNQVMMETVVNLYLAEKVNERVKISEEDKQTKCSELRRQYPAKVGPLPLDSCLDVAGEYLKNQTIAKEMPQIQKDISERIAIEKNPNFDRDDYFKNQVEYYKTMRKEGGCVDVAPSSSKTDAVPPGSSAK